MPPSDMHAAAAPEDQVVQDRIAAFDAYAQRHGWNKVPIHAQNRVQRQRYERPCGYNPTTDAEETERIDCWPTTLTVGSYLLHPRQGRKTQLFRRQCTLTQIEQIFANPRIHTNQGYHERRHRYEQQGNNAHNDHDEDHQKRKRYDEDMDEFDDDEDNGRRRTKRRRLACSEGQKCRNWQCPYAHSPRCFYATRCWFQPHCWFDHTHGLCRNGAHCTREDCWFSHRNPDLYY